ncbi:MAG: DUF2752 domain-containing protein [Egibacteraceae bacterium]
MTTYHPLTVQVADVPAWAPPALVAATAAAGCVTLALFDPNEPGRYPTCPFLAVTGRWCPGCGSLRAVRTLLGGDIVTAAGLNVLLLVALPYVIYSWLAWALPTVGVRRLPVLRVPAAVIWAVFAVIAAFWMLRNLPLAPFTLLAP